MHGWKRRQDDSGQRRLDSVIHSKHGKQLQQGIASSNRAGRSVPKTRGGTDETSLGRASPTTGTSSFCNTMEDTSRCTTRSAATQRRTRARFSSFSATCFCMISLALRLALDSQKNTSSPGDSTARVFSQLDPIQTLHPFLAPSFYAHSQPPLASFPVPSSSAH